MHFLDIDNEKPNDSIKTGHTPDAVAVSRDGELLFVANRFSNTISAIDLINNRLIRNIKVEREPVTITISPDDRYCRILHLFSANTENNLRFEDGLPSIQPNLPLMLPSERPTFEATAPVKLPT